jgi:hypothetical protein
VRILDWSTGDVSELRAFIGDHLAAGFWTSDDLAEWVGEWVDDSGVVDPGDAQTLLATMWRERLDEQRNWRDTGSFGRLETVFAELEADGILARSCFQCCQQCANSAIAGERTPHPHSPDGYAEWGYVFFHEQDAEGLSVQPATLYLGYGVFRPAPYLPAGLDMAGAREESYLRIAARVVDAAREERLDATWSGSADDRVVLTLTDWRKPLPGTSVGTPRRRLGLPWRFADRVR